MALKTEQEITVRVICSNEELLKILKEKGFKENRRYSLDDYYLIPKKLDIQNLSEREILKEAIIIRYIIDSGKIFQKIAFKIKNITEMGEIIEQKTINCNVVSIEESKELFEAMGYYEIMNIKEEDIVYEKDDFKISVKFLKNRNTLIEIETSPEYNTVDKLKEKIKEINLPIEENEFFVRKAEEELKRVLNR